jgi:type VI secretion system protein ImpL
MGDAAAKYRGNVVNFLNAANEVTTTTFQRGEESAHIEFDVLIQGAPGIKEIALTVDGEKIRYRNGPEVWGTLTWPGEGTPGAMVEAHGFGKDADLQREGEWGLFRLLEAGQVKKLEGTRVFVVQWDFRDEGAGLINMKIRPKRVDTPFFGFGSSRAFMSIFRTSHLNVPRAVMMGAGKCSGGRG